MDRGDKMNRNNRGKTNGCEGREPLCKMKNLGFDNTSS